MPIDLVILSTVDPAWIANSPEAFEIPALLKEAENLGLRAKVVHPNACTVTLPKDGPGARAHVGDEEISEARFAIVLGAAVTLPAVHLVCTILHDNGCILLDPLEAAEQAIAGKGGQMYRCAAVRGGVGATVAYSPEGLVGAIRAFDFADGRSLVVKPNKGARGSGVMRIQSAGEAEQAAAFYRANGFVAFLLEEFIQIEAEYRVLTLDGGMIASARKTPRTGDFLGNAAADAEFAAEALPEAGRVVLDETAVHGLAGVDIALQICGAAFLVEINRQPQWRALQKATDVNVAARILGHLAERERAAPGRPGQ